MNRSLCLVAVLLITSSGCSWLRSHHDQDRRDDRPGLTAVDSGGRAVQSLQVGSSLEVEAQGLRPRAMYELRLAIGDRAAEGQDARISFARSMTDAAGRLEPVLLWHQSGVVGCAAGAERRLEQPFTFRTFDEAERALADRVLTVSIHPVDEAPSAVGRRLPAAGAATRVISLPVIARRSPLVYPSDRNGCLVNGQETGRADLFVSGRHFEPGIRLVVSVVPNQRAWFVGDAVHDVTGRPLRTAAEEVRVDESGRFTVRAWQAGRQHRGTFDIVARRAGDNSPVPRVRASDIVSFGSDTALVLYLLYPAGGPLMDIAGRPVLGTPYFEFADSFAEAADPVWGAVDPTYVPVGHPGGTSAAYYVVQHRDAPGWAGATGLVDVSGGVEVHPVKAGCINGTDTVIWPAPLTPGQYDVVVDFLQDADYDDTTDFLDGAVQVGFAVAADPYDLGPFPVGADSYSQDDFFAMLGSRADVDLRAVVRYPATAAGIGTPVAAGSHPIFLIEHGNHSSCNTPGFDCTGSYDTVHVGCPDREKNHEGYMGLLDRLASHGIIAVSIDAFDLTGCVPQLISERGQLILRHLELWSHMHDLGTFPTFPDFFTGRFGGHVDLSRISVSGHSRGGEASVAAYMLNTAFAIGSVSSIAPVDGQGYVLPDVPYFVILPAADGDVFNLSGQRIYDRAGSGIADASTKSGIDVYGASHNLFNTVWAADGDDGAPGRDDFIPAVDQQRLGEAWLAAWARLHLNGETVYADMFRGGLTFPSYSGRKIYPMHHETDHSRLEAGGGALAVPSAGATVALVGPFFSVHQTAALRVGWPAIGAQVEYSVPPGQRDLTGFEAMSFRVAQTNSASNPPVGDQDFRVELIGGGQPKSTFAGAFGSIPKPYNHSGVFQNVMTTVRIPLHSFIVNNSGVALNDVTTVRITFSNPTQGEIYVDDLEFSR